MKTSILALLILATSNVFAMKFVANPITLYSNAGSKMAANLGFYLETTCKPVEFYSDVELPNFATLEERGYLNSYPIFSDVGTYTFKVIAECVGTKLKTSTTIELVVR